MLGYAIPFYTLHNLASLNCPQPTTVDTDVMLKHKYNVDGNFHSYYQKSPLSSRLLLGMILIYYLAAKMIQDW